MNLWKCGSWPSVKPYSLANAIKVPGTEQTPKTFVQEELQASAGRTVSKWVLNMQMIIERIASKCW